MRDLFQNVRVSDSHCFAENGKVGLNFVSVKQVDLSFYALRSWKRPVPNSS